MPPIPPAPKRSIWKTARWVILATLVLVMFLMMSRPAHVAPPMTPDAVKQDAATFQQKLTDIAQAHESGQPTETHFDSQEVNAALQQAAAQPAGANTAAPADATAPPPVQTSEVYFEDDVVKGQFTTQLYGKDVTVTVAGRLGSQDGYVTFAPTEFKIGDMPVPVSMVDPALQRKLAEPENHEKLKLPAFISGLRVEKGQLVLEER